MRRLVPVGAALAALFLAACGSSAPASDSLSALLEHEPCEAKIAVMAPIGTDSGPQPSQLNWARVAIEAFNATHQSMIQLVPYNDYAEPARARLEAREIAGNHKVAGVVGPPTTVDTEAAGPIFDKAGLAYVSPSATGTQLTSGKFENFYRVVGSNAMEGETIVQFIAQHLHGDPTVVVRDSDPYSSNLSSHVVSEMRGRGLRVSEVNLASGANAAARTAARVPTSTGVVVLTLVRPFDSQHVAEALTGANVNATLIASDSAFDLRDFHVTGALVAAPYNDVNSMVQGEQTMRLYSEIYGDLSPFASSAYLAAYAVAAAAVRSCRDGVATRAGVLSALPATNVDLPLGLGHLSFDARHESTSAEFHIFRIEGEAGYSELP